MGEYEEVRWVLYWVKFNMEQTVQNNASIASRRGHHTMPTTAASLLLPPPAAGTVVAACSLPDRRSLAITR